MPHPSGFSFLRTPFAMGCAAALSFILVGCATPHRVTMPDMQPSLGGLTLLDRDPLEAEKVEYLVTDKPNYDEFFRSAAFVQAGLIVSTAATESLTSNLKNRARTYAAANALDQNVKEIMGTTKPEEMSEGQAVALLAAKKKKGELTAEEKTFATKSVDNIAVLVAYLTQTTLETKSLTTTGTGLIQSVNSDFVGLEAAKVPSVTAGINSALDNVRSASTKAPELAKRLTRLSGSLKPLQ